MANMARGALLLITDTIHLTSCLSILHTNAWCTSPQQEDATSGREKNRGFCDIHALYLLKLNDTYLVKYFNLSKRYLKN